MKQIKTLVLGVVAFLSVLVLYAQPREASVMIDNENRNAVMISIEQPEKITGEALQQRLQRSGLKERSRNGITKYKGITLSEISPDQVDIYTKVEKGPNNSSVVYMAVSHGYNNFTNGTADSLITENIKTFLQSFVKDADYHSADVGISNQISDVNKNEKAYQKLLDEQRNLLKKKSGIESRLIEIQNELAAKGELIDKKKTGIEDARIKRSNIGDQ